MTVSAQRISVTDSHGRSHELSVRTGGTGRPVLMIHGIPTSSLLWRKVQPLLAPHAQTLAVDLLGYGDSDAPADVSPSLAVQADLLHDLLRRNDLSDVVVVGHDIGGGVAQLLAVEASERVSGLVLINSIVTDSFPEPSIARLADPEWDERILDVDLVAGFTKSLTKGTELAGGDVAEAARLYAAPFDRLGGRAAYLRAARALNPDDLTARTGDIVALQIPVDIIWGEDDPFQPIRYGQWLAEQLPHGRLHVLPGGRHFTPEDHFEEIATIIREQLDAD